MKYLLPFFLTLISLSTSLQACSQEADKVEYIQPDAPLSLPLPRPPQTMKSPAERADFIAFHFWDALDFSDTERLTDDFLGTNMSEFLSLFDVCSERGAETAMSALLLKASLSPEALRRVVEVGESYAVRRESPVMTERTAALFLTLAPAFLPAGSAEAQRLDYLGKRFMMNTPGRVATDFPVKMRDGSLSSVMESGKGSKTRILLFYDEECDNCSRLIESMSTDESLSSEIRAGTTSVTAVNATASPESFAGSLKIPSAWQDCVPMLGAGISIDDLYDLTVMPAVYILDENGVVVERTGRR